MLRTGIKIFGKHGSIYLSGLLNLGAAAESIATLDHFHATPYKTNPTRLFVFTLFLPLLLYPCIMDALKTILSPLGMGTGAIQDTLVTT